MVSNQELFLAFYSYKWVSGNEASPFSSRYFKIFPKSITAQLLCDGKMIGNLCVDCTVGFPITKFFGYQYF